VHGHRVNVKSVGELTTQQMIVDVQGTNVRRVLKMNIAYAEAIKQYRGHISSTDLRRSLHDLNFHF